MRCLANPCAATTSTSGRPLQLCVRPRHQLPSATPRSLQQRALKTDEQASSKTEAQATTEKLGLEAGLFKVLTSKEEGGVVNKTNQAKQLLAQYGSAYLLTSTTLAAISFALCYWAVDAGVDVKALLARINIEVTETSESVSTAAIAYAAHKALSPVRFPPTVALTPTVAKWLGRKSENSA
ncbi:hypothetical protein QJQ45_020574 [Haematococcus lacustris]|nr:hypothetical protein QJQ45_020574 [Haematococcus lacustris]